MNKAVSMTAIFLIAGSLGIPQSQTAPENSARPKFTELSADAVSRLEQQRAIIAAAKTRYGVIALTRTRKDLHVLQKLIDDAVFSKSQTYELQSLGVAFGDVLASELPLHWVMITEEYGTDPTLRFKATSLNVNALTMISKRIETGQTLNLSRLLRLTKGQLAAYENGSH